MSPRAARGNAAEIIDPHPVAAAGAGATAASRIENARAAAAAPAEAANALAVDADRISAVSDNRARRGDPHGAADTARAAVAGVGSGPSAAAAAASHAAERLAPDAVGLGAIRG